MVKRSQDNLAAEVIAYQDKILRAINKHGVLHYTQLNTMMGVHKTMRGGESDAYTIALTGLRELGLLTIVSHKIQAGRGIGKKGSKTSQFYCDPDFADIVYWAKKPEGNLDNKAKTLLEMNKIVENHPKRWIHYKPSRLPIKFMKQNLIKEKPYKRGPMSKKLEVYRGETRYVKTKRFDTAVRVLKKVLDYRHIPY